MSKRMRRPSPAMIIAVVALCLGLGGSAIAAGELTKSDVKKVAKKQADKRLKANVAGSRVNLADKATNADRAGIAGTVDNGAITSPKLGTIVQRSNSIEIADNDGEAVTANCNEGEIAISGGTDTAGVGVEVGWHLNRLVKTGNGWSAAAHNNTGDSGTLIVRVYCLQA